jgi:serine/threonine protein kinase
MLAIGSVLDGRYEIVGRLGAGGMADVFHARRVLLGDEVAIKVIRATSEDPQVVRDRFLRESRAVARLRHPNIVTILDFDIDQSGRPYLVMEYLNGPNLDQELRVRGRFDVPGFGQVLLPICSALQLAHERGFVHRDLKPGNIVSHRYDSGECVWKIIDFGLVNIADPAETRLTDEHLFMGTAAYAAPEQLSGSAIDRRTDVYSLGVIAYEMLVGERPFRGDTMLTLLDQHLHAAPPDVAPLRPDLPAQIAGGIAKALAKQPDDRWADVAAFARTLAEGLGMGVTRGSPPPTGLLATYDLGAVIGRGRFGSTIHQGTHRALGHPVAIRTFRPSPGMDRDAVRSRFLAEARALQVPHPNIVQVRDFGESGDVLYVVTELFEGCSLGERLAAEGPLPAALLRTFVGQLADAASAVQRHRGAICGAHPDIIRIVRDEDGERVAISSAGICSIRDLLGTLDETALRGRALAGTELPYVAPELLMGRPAVEQSDVFTIGVLAYEMATGLLPFEASSLPELIGVMMVAPPSAAVRRPDLPAAAADVIAGCLAFDPGARHESAAEFLSAWTSAWSGP